MKPKYLLLLLPILILTSLSYVFAEGDTECSGRITGITFNNNFNEGRTSFDAHSGFYIEDEQSVDLGVWGLMPGLAPFSREYAACVEESSDENNDYAIKGYAAGTNIGMISFSCINGKNDAGYFLTIDCPFPDHGVYINSGVLSGYAWTPVLGWMDFDGVTLENGVLSGSASTQAHVDVSFDGVKIYLPGEEYEEPETYDYCDSTDAFCVTVTPDPFLHNAVANNEDGYEISIRIIDFYNSSFDSSNFQNYAEFLDSIQVVWEDTVSLHQVNHEREAVSNKMLDISNFEEKEDGYFVSKNKIVSLAPTSDANTSWTTSTDPRYELQNETIYENNTGIPVEANNLFLKRVEYKDLKSEDGLVVIIGNGVDENVAYANGKPDLSLPFKPAISISVSANDLQDRFLAYAYENLHIDLNKEINAYSNEQLNLYVGSNEDVCKFKFVTEEEEEDSEGDSYLYYNFDFESLNLGVKTEEISASECEPYFYSTIQYTVEGKVIKYVSDGLPRIIEKEMVEPLALIQGNIRGQSVVDKRYKKNWHGYLDVSTNQIRNAITKNLAMLWKGTTVKDADNESCIITALNLDSTFSPGCETANYNFLTEAGENILYFKNAEKIIINELTYDGKWVIISENSNIFIDGNIMNADVDSSLSLISLRDDADWSQGNIYIGTCDKEIKNVEAILYADSLVTSADDGMDFVDGEPQFEDYYARLAMLDCPLKTRSIYGKVTVGGADLDKDLEDPKDYLVLGNGELLYLPLDPEERMRAQIYDLNYLRMYSPYIDPGAKGCPIDKTCGMALCAEEIAIIADPDQILCGEYDDEDSDTCAAGQQCDGINPYKVYVTQEEFMENDLNEKYFGPDGDLVININEAEIPQGLEYIDDKYFYYPLYIEFVEPDSFIFQSY